MANRYTILAKLEAKREGQYTQYVFKNLDEPDNSWDRYILCTRCPNWECHEDIQIGIEGYLTFEPVEAGSQYYNPNSAEYCLYKYSGIYFINFVKSPKPFEDNNSYRF